MFSPYEELEYLSDYLPAEGEGVLVIRENGELVCKPWRQDDLRDGVDDADLYGRLVQANERLATAHSLPMWCGLIGLIWLAIALHGGLGLDWSQWYLVPGVAFPAMFGCLLWARRRQELVFRSEVLPSLRIEIARRHISPYALIAGVRQHPEFRSLLDELVRWSPAMEPVMRDYRSR
ncbi:MAG: hypothetical protein KDA90_03810 [Planctomycetaceae bacterium]|nr:hypothetical protein [Planctomycetaceae bacterium]